MKPDTMTATALISVPRSGVFDVLADPSIHGAIDGTHGAGKDDTIRRLLATIQHQAP
jgi:hypothetical protein